VEGGEPYREVQTNTPKTCPLGGERVKIGIKCGGTVNGHPAPARLSAMERNPHTKPKRRQKLPRKEGGEKRKKPVSTGEESCS